MHRRDFLAAAGAAAGLALAPRWRAQAPADATLRIAPAEIEIASGRRIKTTAYNGAAPGPLLRFPAGRPIAIDVVNATDTPELVHWHGFTIPSPVDGAAEEGTPRVAPGARQRYAFTPSPPGTRYYHTHTFAGRDLGRGTFSGQFGVFYIEPRQDPDAYDQELFVSIHGWDPYMSTLFEDDGSLEAVYKYFTLNGRMLGAGDPLRVQPGQRLMLRIVNAGATLSHRLALPGHRFTVVALDGNRVPAPQSVEVLELAPAERVDAIVTLDQPGVWVFGSLDDAERKNGLGLVVEYAGRSGPPRWIPPAAQQPIWDYTPFGAPPRPPDPDAILVPLVFKRKFAGNRWIDKWTINGKMYPDTDPIRVAAGKKYRLVFDNQSDDPHPVHLHRHSFELLKVAGRPTAGVMKDVVLCPPRRQVEVELLANNPGPSLFHCHQQMHMDAGFMALLVYV